MLPLNGFVDAAHPCTALKMMMMILPGWPPSYLCPRPKYNTKKHINKGLWKRQKDVIPIEATNKWCTRHASSSTPLHPLLRQNKRHTAMPQERHTKYALTFSYITFPQSPCEPPPPPLAPQQHVRVKSLQPFVYLSAFNLLIVALQ